MQTLGGLGGLLLVVQVIAAVHALKTRRAYWWLYVILFMPGLGAAVYFVVEVLPELRGSGALNRVGSDLIQLVDPGRSLRRLEEDVEVSDTFRNRQALARGYVGARQYEEAIAQYQKCLVGTFKDDPCCLLELAHAHLLAGLYSEAISTVERLEKTSPRFRPDERRLLLARTFEVSGQTERALEQYAAIAESWPGDEARCRYALLLEENGQVEKAREVFQQILLRARRSPYYYRRAQREWIKIARQHLGKTPASSGER
jgi:hypothetical protein